MFETELERLVKRDGFTFARGNQVRERLERDGPLIDGDAFRASWSDLGSDEYMADGGRYRRRRHAVFAAGAGDAFARRAPRQPHYQSREYNPLNGGLERWFSPIAEAVSEGPTMLAVLSFGLSFFARLRPGASWKIEVHQFRIEAKAGQPGRPTPEGAHRDGVDGVIVLMVRRENVASGTTMVCDLSGCPKGEFTLTDPFDCAIVDDARVMHGVTPVVPLDPTRPAYRDVLVATYLKT